MHCISTSRSSILFLLTGVPLHFYRCWSIVFLINTGNSLPTSHDNRILEYDRLSDNRIVGIRDMTGSSVIRILGIKDMTASAGKYS